MYGEDGIACGPGAGEGWRYLMRWGSKVRQERAEGLLRRGKKAEGRENVA